MDWGYVVIYAWTILFLIATARATTTAISKTYDLSTDGLDEYERLIFLEDAEHWWTAVFINALLLSIGVVAMVDPIGPDNPGTWHGDYVISAFLFFALLINIRIERHGYYFRKRNDINLFGRPRDEGMWVSAKRTFLGRRAEWDAESKRGRGQNHRETEQDTRGEGQDRREKEQDVRSGEQDVRGDEQDVRGTEQDARGTEQDKRQEEQDRL